MTGCWELMAKGQRNPLDLSDVWEAGAYTLLLDQTGTPTAEERAKGDTLALDATEATRLGNMSVIAPPNSRTAIEARVAAGKGSRRDEILVGNVRTTGVWISG